MNFLYEQIERVAKSTESANVRAERRRTEGGTSANLLRKGQIPPGSFNFRESDDVMLERVGRGFGAVGDVQLGEDRAQVELHAVFGNAEAGRDVLV